MSLDGNLGFARCRKTYKGCVSWPKYKMKKSKFITNPISSSNINMGENEFERVESYVFLGHKIRISRKIKQVEGSLLPRQTTGIA